MADSYDYQIDTLKFRVATDNTAYSSTNQGRPFIRATAPFRKDQFDSSARAGDQSLTGWWTRGQFSFHKGQGIKYYEVLDGDSVLDRCAKMDSLDPWTPGEVRLNDSRRPGGVDGIYPLVGGSGTTVTGYSSSCCLDSQNNLWTIDTGATPRIVYTTMGSAGYGYSTPGTATTYTMPAGVGNPRSVVANDKNKVFIAAGNTITVTTLNPSTGVPGTGTVLWTNNNSATAADNYFRSIWWAKGRLWAVDAVGNWYCLPAAGGTVASGGGTYLFWKSGIPDDGAYSYWVLAESPGPIYLAIDDAIWSVSLDSGSGGVATLAYPTQVATLGAGVGIRALIASRGLLSILTGDDFRVAAIDASGGLTVGPIAIRFWDSRCSSMVASGDRIYFGAQPAYNESTRVYEVDLSWFTDTLVPAYVYYDTPNVVLGGGALAIVGGSAFVVVPNEGTEARYWYQSGEYYFSGKVTTGYHRFGTLDSKRFYSVTVHTKADSYGGLPYTSATGGTVQVEQIDSDGNATVLGTMNAKDSKMEFLLQGSSTERMALRFTLNADSNEKGVTPVLLGYQLKALPAPKRQRIIQVPLVVRDTVRLRGGIAKGRKGSAWSRLSALEALESSQAIVPFTDFRTGETGNAYIDSVEFYGDILRESEESSFGGIAYVTLRVVS